MSKTGVRPLIVNGYCSSQTLAIPETSVPTLPPPRPPRSLATLLTTGSQHCLKAILLCCVLLKGRGTSPAGRLHILSMKFRVVYAPDKLLVID